MDEQLNSEQLTGIMRVKYGELNDAGMVEISPRDLAVVVLNKIDPDKEAPFLVSHAAILELRQMARMVCRKRQEEGERESEQGDLFEFRLQQRYPATRKRAEDDEVDEVYVLRENLTCAERRRNSARLRSESHAKLVHANALDAETDFLIDRGSLKEESDRIAVEE
jgi:hypothetical protein